MRILLLLTSILFILGFVAVACDKDEEPTSSVSDDQLQQKNLPTRFSLDPPGSMFSEDGTSSRLGMGDAQCITDGAFHYIAGSFEQLEDLKKALQSRVLSMNTALNQGGIFDKIGADNIQIAVGDGAFAFKWKDWMSVELAKLWGFESVEEVLAAYPQMSGNFPVEGTQYPNPPMCVMDLKALGDEDGWDYALYFDWAGNITGCDADAKSQYPSRLKWKLNPDYNADTDAAIDKFAMVELRALAASSKLKGSALYNYDHLNNTMTVNIDGQAQQDFGDATALVTVTAKKKEKMSLSDCVDAEGLEGCKLLVNEVDFDLDDTEFAKVGDYVPKNKFSVKFKAKAGATGGYLETTLSYKENNISKTNQMKEMFDSTGCVDTLGTPNDKGQWEFIGPDGTPVDSATLEGNDWYVGDDGWGTGMPEFEMIVLDASKFEALSWWPTEIGNYDFVLVPQGTASYSEPVYDDKGNITSGVDSIGYGWVEFIEDGADGAHNYCINYYGDPGLVGNSDTAGETVTVFYAEFNPETGELGAWTAGGDVVLAAGEPYSAEDPTCYFGFDWGEFEDPCMETPPPEWCGDGGGDMPSLEEDFTYDEVANTFTDNVSSNEFISWMDSTIYDPALEMEFMDAYYCEATSEIMWPEYMMDTYWIEPFVDPAASAGICDDLMAWIESTDTDYATHVDSYGDYNIEIYANGADPAMDMPIGGGYFTPDTTWMCHDLYWQDDMFMPTPPPAPGTDVDVYWFDYDMGMLGDLVGTYTMP